MTSPQSPNPNQFQPSLRAQIVEHRTYLRPLNDEGTVFETPEQATDRMIAHQRWLWERAKGGMQKVMKADMAYSYMDWVTVPLTDAEESELRELRDLILDRKVMLAGRTRWLGGTAVAQLREASQFNCSFTEVRTVHDVVDVLWLLLQGCGVGFRPIVGNLNGFAAEIPAIETVPSTLTLEDYAAGIRGAEHNEETFDAETGVWTIKVGDSAEAWAKSIGKLLAGKRKATKLVLDFSNIRPAGVRLKGYGWISSGYEPIARAYTEIAGILNKRVNQLLTRIDILDAVNWLGTILSSRRSAQIALMAFGEPEWDAFAVAKKDYWSPEVNQPQRAQSNNSLVFYEKPTKRELRKAVEMMIAAGGSEPGFINGQAALKRAPWYKGVNPCAEILLGDKAFCNLVETVLYRFNGDEKALHRAHYIVARANYRQTCVNLDDGVLQRGWHELNEFLRLTGVGVTGAVSWEYVDEKSAWKDLREVGIRGADSMADELGFPRSKAVTTIKPSGCLPADATIVTADGIFTIAEIMAEHPANSAWGEKVFKTVQADGSIVESSKTFDNGLAEVYKIKTTFNLPLASTAQHKWQLVDGTWKETIALQKGDELLVVPGLYKKDVPYKFKKLNEWRLRPHGRKGEEITQPDEMTTELAWLLGYLFGDGAMSQSKKRFRFVDVNEDNLNRARAAFGSIFDIQDLPQVRQLSDRKASTFEFGHSALWNWFYANGLVKDVSTGVPNAIRTGAKEHVIAFIAGLIDADGCYHKENENVIFTQSDDDFVRSFQQVAWAVGLAFGRSHNTKGSNLQKHKDIWLCTLGGHSQPSSVEVLFSLSNKLKGKNIRTWNRAYSVKVEDVVFHDIVPTADIEVPELHKYVAYGAVSSHNTQSKTAGIEGAECPEGIHKPLGRYIFNNVGFSKHDPLVAKLKAARYHVFDNPYDPTGVLVRLPVEYSNIDFDKVTKTVVQTRILDFETIDNIGGVGAVGDYLGGKVLDVKDCGCVVPGLDFKVEKTITVEVNNESAVAQLERYKMVMDNYVDHNCSITISYDPSEADDIVDWLHGNWDHYVGVSFIFRNDPSKTAEDLGYAYLPQEVVDEDTFKLYTARLLPLDLSGSDSLDAVDTGEECKTGACPIR